MSPQEFKEKFIEFTKKLQIYSVAADKDWKVKGFIDIDKNVFTLSMDTKLISKILEIHIYPQVAKFAEENGFVLTLPEQ